MIRYLTFNDQAKSLSAFQRRFSVSDVANSLFSELYRGRPWWHNKASTKEERRKRKAKRREIFGCKDSYPHLRSRKNHRNNRQIRV